MAGMNFEASKEIYSSALKCLLDQRGVHAETAVAALSAVCGESLLRASPVDISQLPPGGEVPIAQVATIGPNMLGHLQILLDELLVDHSGDWTAKVPEEHLPLRDPLKLAHELRPVMQELFAKYKLDAEQAAKASCMALALIIRDCQAVLPPSVSVLIASNALVLATKSAPVT